MKTLVNQTDFSDCTPADWEHYFGATLLVWNMPSITNKRRVFLAGSPEQAENGKTYITGQYLTKLKEWKNKRIPYANWNKQLVPLALRDMFFQVGPAVCLYTPNLQRNLKKGPRWNYQGFQYFGTPSPENVTTQSLTWWAFQDLYDRETIPERTLREILLQPNDWGAECDARGFIYDRTTATLNYRAKKIAVYSLTTRVLHFKKDCGLWRSYLQHVERVQENGITLRGAS